MRYTLFFFGFLLFCRCSFAVSFIETETHFYILRYSPSAVVEVKRRTGEERFIFLDNYVNAIFYHQGRIYLSSFQGALYTLDPLSGQLHTVHQGFKDEYWKVFFYDHHALFFFPLNSKDPKCIRLDLNNPDNTVPFPVKHSVKRITCDENHLFLLYQSGDVIDVLYKNTLGFVTKLKGHRCPDHVLVHGGFLYVTWSESQRLTVHDTSNFHLKISVVVGRLPRSMTVDGNHLYVKNKIDSSLSVINLQSHEVTKTLQCKDKSLLRNRLLVKEGVGYLLTWGAKEVWMIDMHCHETIDIMTLSLEYLHCPFLSLTDQFMYIDGHKVIPIRFSWRPADSLILFHDGFEVEGIDLFNDGEEAFKAMISERDPQKAQEFLKVALRCVNSKAYALAAFAYLYEK